MGKLRVLLSRWTGGHIGSDEAGGRHVSGSGEIVMETGKVSSPTSTGATAAASGVDRAGLQQAAKAFEAIFMRQMISSMRSAKLGEDLLGSSASNQFRDMADARVADGMAENGEIGRAHV